MATQAQMNYAHMVIFSWEVLETQIFTNIMQVQLSLANTSTLGLAAPRVLPSGMAVVSWHLE